MLSLIILYAKKYSLLAEWWSEYQLGLYCLHWRAATYNFSLITQWIHLSRMEDGTKSDTELSTPVHPTVTYTRGRWPPDWPQGRHREGQGQSVGFRCWWYVSLYKVFCVTFWGHKNGMVGWYDYVVNELLCLILTEKYWTSFCNKSLLENYIDRSIYPVSWKCEHKSYLYNYTY